jgi:hypothetical protein
MSVVNPPQKIKTNDQAVKTLSLLHVQSLKTIISQKNYTELPSQKGPPKFFLSKKSLNNKINAPSLHANYQNSPNVQLNEGTGTYSQSELSDQNQGYAIDRFDGNGFIRPIKTKSVLIHNLVRRTSHVSRLRKYFFVVYFAVLFPRYCAKQYKIRLLKIVGPSHDSHLAISNRILQQISGIFDKIFKSPVFEKNLEKTVSEITEKAFNAGLDLVLAGFDEFSIILTNASNTDIVAFMANTLVGGGIFISDFLSLFVGSRIRITKQNIIAFNNEQPSSDLMSISIFIYVHIFLKNYIQIEYNIDKFVLLVCFVLYHYLINYFAKLLPFKSGDTDIENQFLKPVFQWRDFDVRKTIANLSAVPGLGHKKTIKNSGPGDSPIQGAYEIYTNPTFLNNPKISQKIMPRFVGWVKKINDSLLRYSGFTKQAILSFKMERMTKLRKVNPDDQFFILAEKTISDKIKKLEALRNAKK